MREDDFLLSGYRRILETALANNYQFVSFNDIGAEAEAYTCLLRHDIDVELMGCARMAAVERELRVRATYFLMTRSTTYNLFCVEGLRVVENLIAAGHEIGLHFMGELSEGASAAALAERVAAEAAWLEREFGKKVHAVSFHQPSRAILDGDLMFEGLVNTYSHRQMREYFYVSDTNMQWRHEHPTEIFSRRLYRRLHLLIHPIWWTEQPLSPVGKWLAALRGQNETVIAHWEQRERTLAGVRLRDYPSDVPSGD